MVYGGQRARGVSSPFAAALMGNDKAMVAGVGMVMTATRKKASFPSLMAGIRI